MKKFEVQVFFLAFFPWVLGVMSIFMNPRVVIPAMKSKIGMMTIAGAILWELVGVKVTRKFIPADDPKARITILLPMVVFFFTRHICDYSGSDFGLTHS